MEILIFLLLFFLSLQNDVVANQQRKTTMERLPNRTIIGDDATPTIISHRSSASSLSSNSSVTCDKVCSSNCRSFWTLVPVKLKLLSKLICQSLHVVVVGHPADSRNKINIHSDYVGKCRKNTSCSRRQTIFWQCCLIFMYIFLLNLSTSTCFAARNEETSGCTFPSRWEGSWFQSGVPAPIHIKGSVLSNRGKCVASDGDKFLLVR